MSAHGISPTWRQENEFANGAPWFFDPEVIQVIFLTCGLDLQGDIFITHNVGLVCQIIEPEPNAPRIITLTCDVDKLGMNILIDMGLSCTMETVDP